MHSVIVNCGCCTILHNNNSCGKMENNVSELLKSWGCNEETVNIFVENDINIEVLRQLTVNDLEELVPKSFGMRRLISMKLTELRKKDSDDSQSLATTLSIQTSNETFNEDNIFNVINRENASSKLTYSPEQFPDFDLKTLLQTSPMGNSVLTFYDTYNCLDNTRRTRLVDIIIKHLYAYIIRNRLRPDEYNKIAAKIITIFPTECMGTYFIAPVEKADSISGKPILAKGELVDKVRNLVHKCEEAVPKRKCLEESVISNDVTPCLNSQNHDMLWLQLNTEPWDEVIKKWEVTYDFRHNDKTHNINDFLEHWPILRKVKNGSLLSWKCLILTKVPPKTVQPDLVIQYDFRKLYPEHELKLFTDWDLFFETLVNRMTPITDSTLVNLLEIRTGVDDDNARFIIELTALPYLIPPKGRLVINSPKRIHWKFSTLETVEAIIIQAKTPGDIDEAIRKKSEKAYSRKQTIQPYILYEGLSIQEAKNFYIVIDNIFLQLDTAKNAFDTLFKIFHAFNAKYPVETHYIYTLIQTCAYNIYSKNDVIPPNLVNILSVFSKTKS